VQLKPAASPARAPSPPAPPRPAPVRHVAVPGAPPVQAKPAALRPAVPPPPTRFAPRAAAPPRLPVATLQRMEEPPWYRTSIEIDDSIYGTREGWDPNASDSETELEDESKTVTVIVKKRKRKPKRKVDGEGEGKTTDEQPKRRRTDTGYVVDEEEEGGEGKEEETKTITKKLRNVVYNNTKRRARSRRGKTLRDPRTRERKVPRIFNLLTSGPVHLSQDAKTVHDVISTTYTTKSGEVRTNQSFGATTVVCAVVLRSGKARKYCFTNLDQTSPGPVREMAERLGYHVINAPATHAESEMMMYLRAYKAGQLLGIGCDKPHCQECAAVMAHLLESGIPTDNIVSNETFTNYHMPPFLQEITGETVRPKEWSGFSIRDYPLRPGEGSSGGEKEKEKETDRKSDDEEKSD
jgi:hypothetical protein